MDTRPQMTLDTRQGRRALLASVRASRDPFAPMNLSYAKLIAGFLWTAGALVALAMAPLAPPTVALGTAGWAVAAVLAAVGAFIAIRRFDSARSATPYEMLVTGFVGVAIIATLEWLAGGRSSPYHELFVLPVVFAVAVHSRRRAILFFLWLALAIALPALYGRVNSSQADDMVAQLGMLLALGVVARALIIMSAPSAAPWAPPWATPRVARGGISSPGWVTGAPSTRPSPGRSRELSAPGAH